jgi:hypothetical protein
LDASSYKLCPLSNLNSISTFLSLYKDASKLEKPKLISSPYTNTFLSESNSISISCTVITNILETCSQAEFVKTIQRNIRKRSEKTGRIWN